MVNNSNRILINGHGFLIKEVVRKNDKREPYARPYWALANPKSRNHFPVVLSSCEGPPLDLCQVMFRHTDHGYCK